MKSCLGIFVFLLTVSPIFSQTTFQLRISHLLNEQNFALNKVVKHPEAAYQTKFSRLTYYISGIELVHDGGQIKSLPESIYIVYAQKDSIFDLGKFSDMNEVEAIRFSIGVDSSRNHLDPASYGPLHPLAPQNPDMHWGWSAGYRFAAIEGKAGTGFTQTFEIHALGDQNYFTTEIKVKSQSIASSKKEIHIYANYGVLLKSLDVSQGLFMHGSTGAAVTVLENFRDHVFSSDLSSSTEDQIDFMHAIIIAPNPTTKNNISFKVNQSLNSPMEYSLFSTDGQMIVSGRTQTLEAGKTIFLDYQAKPGVYLLRVEFDHKIGYTKKFIVVGD